MNAILKKELNTYFSTFIGYVFVMFFVLPVGIVFVGANVFSLSPNYTTTLSTSMPLFLFIIPLLTMRLFSEEKRQKTDQLLFTAPVSVFEIVMGKFLAAFCLFMIGFIITMVFPIMIASTGSLPVATTISGIIGYMLLVSCFIAVGLFVSAQSENQIISALATFVTLLLLLLVEYFAPSMPVDRLSSSIFLLLISGIIIYSFYNSTKNIVVSAVVLVIDLGVIVFLYLASSSFLDGLIGKILIWFSLSNRFRGFESGVLNVGDMVYYITFIIAFIYLTVASIERKRWS